MTYEAADRIAWITLDRPERGNGITLAMPQELAACVERADLDPSVHVIALSGNGKGFCGGYDLVESAEGAWTGARAGGDPPPGSPLDPAVQAANHDPHGTWVPLVDFAMMRRNVRGFMSLVWADKPVVCKVRGFCVAGGTDLALCADLLLVAEDARIGYPPARVWGVPTTAMWASRIGAQRAKRLLFTGDLITGAQAADWGLALEAPPPHDLDRRFAALCERIALVPVNQLIAHKLLVNRSLAGADLASAQTLGVLLDGAARHTPEGFAFQREASAHGFRAAVRARDERFEAQEGRDVGLG